MRLRAPLRVAAFAVALLTTALPAISQESTVSDTDTPLIPAPDHSGRVEPLAQPGISPSRAGHAAVNNFAANAAPTPDIAAPIPESLPVVVELFTSQGCSSCMPADQMMAVLAEMKNVIPLSFHVDYWDYLGWADSFAKPEFTARQEAYARAAGEHSLYTPQLIFDGQDTAVAPGPVQLMGLIDARRAAPALVHTSVESTAEGDTIRIMPLTELSTSIDVLLVRYLPERTVKIKAGENRGHEMTYINVVLSIDKLADWDGKNTLTLTIRPDDTDDSAPADTKRVVLVQEDLYDEDMPGLILAAVNLE